MTSANTPDPTITAEYAGLDRLLDYAEQIVEQSQDLTEAEALSLAADIRDACHLSRSALASGAGGDLEERLWEEARIRELVREGDGLWRSCSGCLELEDGQNVHGYPNSAIFGCILGGGCSECGGLGAVWDTTDYVEMGKVLSTPEPKPAPDHAELVAEAHQWISDFGYDLPNACQLMRRLADLLAAFPSEKAVSQLSDTVTALMGSTVDGLSRIEELAAENARLRGIIYRYVDGSNVAPEDEAFVAEVVALAPADGEE